MKCALFSQKLSTGIEFELWNYLNYISDEEMIEFTTDNLSKGEKYLLEDFMNDVEKLL